MTKFILIIFSFVSFNSYALGGYNSLSESHKKVTKQIVATLGIEADKSTKYKIYDDISYMFNSDWHSMKFGLDELSSSKFKGENSKGIVELAFNSKDQGTVFLTYIYKPEIKQILVLKKQVRYGQKDKLIAEFERRKKEQDQYIVLHETDSYALLQQKGKVSYEFFHIGNSTASLVYSSQNVIDF